MQNKNNQDLDERFLKKNFNDTRGYWGCDEKFCLMIGKDVYLYVMCKWVAGKK